MSVRVTNTTDELIMLLQDGVASCIPGAPLNTSAVLPCIEFFHGSEGMQFFDTSCKYQSLYTTWLAINGHTHGGPVRGVS